MVDNCFSIYHTSRIKLKCICDNIPTNDCAKNKNFVPSEVTSTWLIMSKLANQRARKIISTSAV